MSQLNKIISPIGYIDQQDGCLFALNKPNIRSRESVDPKSDLSFYFNEYIVPKYGLNNINVSNVASFMKDLEMNWSKLDSSLKDKVLNIMVDNIFSNNFDFRNALLAKLNVPNVPGEQTKVKSEPFTNIFGSNKETFRSGKESFTSVESTESKESEESDKEPKEVKEDNKLKNKKKKTKESFGSSINTNVFIIIGVGIILIIILLFFLNNYFKNKKVEYPFPKNT
jgi:hypothetical protein